MDDIESEREREREKLRGNSRATKSKKSQFIICDDEGNNKSNTSNIESNIIFIMRAHYIYHQHKNHTQYIRITISRNMMAL